VQRLLEAMWQRIAQAREDERREAAVRLPEAADEASEYHERATRGERE
jgi:hypothetical protein